jgi:predicted esterase
MFPLNNTSSFTMIGEEYYRIGGAQEDTTLHLPRILCLHGGGTNAHIFRAQCRALDAPLRSRFRLCFAEAPFPSQAGPDVLSVYKDWGPFRRWLRWHPDHPERDAESTIEAIEESLAAAVEDDDRKGATGEWVALLGFSQGAKLAASLLLLQQVRAEKLGRQRAGSSFRFAVLMAGRLPLVSLDPELVAAPTVADVLQICCAPRSSDKKSLGRGGGGEEIILRLPTIHVHGLRDPGLELHRLLLEQCCEEGSTRLVEWDGDHRLPIKTKDVSPVVEVIIAVATETGILK